MNDATRPSVWIGKPVERVEDPPLVTGRARFAGDMAVTFIARGGVCLMGGVAPRLLRLAVVVRDQRVQLLDHRRDAVAPLGAIENAVMADILGHIITLLVLRQIGRQRQRRAGLAQARNIVALALDRLEGLGTGDEQERGELQRALGPPVQGRPGLVEVHADMAVELGVLLVGEV